MHGTSHHTTGLPLLPPFIWFSDLVTELIFHPDNLRPLGCEQMGSLLSAIGLCSRVVSLYRWAWARGFLPRNGISKPFPRRGEIVSLLLIEFPFKLRTLLSATRVPVKRDSSSKKQKIIWWGKKNMSGRGGRKGEITKPNVKSSRIYVCNKASRS